MIKLRCNSCATKIGVDDKYAGRKIKCPKCAAANVVPADSGHAPAEVSPSSDIFADALSTERNAPAESPVLNDFNPSEPRRRSPAPATLPREATPKRGRSRPKSINIPFFKIGAGGVALLVAVLIIGGDIFGIVSKFTASNQAKRELQAEVEQNRAAVASNPNDVTGNLKRLDNLASSAERASEKMTGSDKEVAQSLAELLRWIGESSQPYAQAMQKIQGAGGVDPSTLSSAEAVTQRLAMVDELDKANEKLASDTSDLKGKLQEILDKHHMSEAGKRSAMEGFAQASGKLALLPKMRETDRRIVASMRGLLLVLQDQFGHWRSGPAGMHFDSKQAGTDYNKHYQALQKAAQEQAAIQAQSRSM